ncbi:MAG TPA: aminotransferase class V-fold PLP-dependent enzyme [Thermoanaerobaculia bacterium]|nr:aminotransferase class V-fold PLP-dependent enzyme [Thermoanaerobaculia bacterium]
MSNSLLDLARDRAAAFLRELPDRHAGAQATRDELFAALHVPLSDDGEDPAAVIDALSRGADRGLIACAGPRYFGFVIGGSLPVALAADWLTSAWDQNAGIYATSPAASVVEDITREWLLDLFDLPRTSSVGFVTGGQMANFTALAAARHGVLRRAGWNVEDDGLTGAPPVHLVVSAASHITIHSSMRMLGFGTRALIKVEADEQGRMRADSLRETLRKLDGSIIVCAQAGNVNSGDVDPLRELAGIAHERNGWLHVDGAFGLWGRATSSKHALLDGCELADSWANDAHKWLNVPYDSGIVIVRDSASHRAAMTLSAEYLQQTTGVERDNFDWVPEFSRRARAFPIYAAIRALGRRGIASLIDGCCDRALQFAEILGRDKRVRILNDVVLNQVLVRFSDSDDITRDVIARVQREGTCWLGGTTWQGNAAMRISVSNWSTKSEDVEKSCEAIVRCLNAAKTA